MGGVIFHMEQNTAHLEINLCYYLKFFLKNKTGEYVVLLLLITTYYKQSFFLVIHIGI